MKKALRYITRKWRKFLLLLIREYRETRRMVEIYLTQRDNEKLRREANKQFVDILKILFLFPISLLPGSVIIITVLELIAKAFKCTIFPTKQKL
ncbi:MULTISPECIES: hypothetical protein [unclassified Nitratiruptor]|uniref:hypothetical protein n=1 Tax=unclassified Nitratiruptor TaxID=2624044 RepID=UPI001915CBDA|nr:MULTISPECIES: hypothetical protein [unclassified Nitratiruptor]BCD59990.1 hypothetical protein NitYY0810_C0753 [Nitratiruptor sp. YY08-10]BCD63913.1 hypothetical protein NitYY0814_C0752 [Nitratiruptor sp. YY08-14]